MTDAFRPPATPYGPGNRGWEFASINGVAVTAIASGVVTFAGQVGGTANVVVKHDNGMLTTYSKLASVTAQVGQLVSQGTKVGTASENVYFGVRVDGHYVDPANLFRSHAYLVDTCHGTRHAPHQTRDTPGGSSACVLAAIARSALPNTPLTR